MKPACTLFIIVIFNCITFAQNTFQKIYYYREDILITDVEHLKNDGKLVAGWSPIYCGSGCKSSVFCLLLDDNGNLIKSKSYSAEVSLTEPKAIVTKDNAFAIFAGLKDNVSGKYNDGVIFKCNKDGNVIWSKKITSKKYSAFTPQLIIENINGDITLVYSVANDKYKSPVIQILRFNSSGRLLKHFTFDTYILSRGDYYTPTMALDTKEGLFISGNINHQEFQGVLTGTILHIDNNGNPVSFKKMNNYPWEAYNSYYYRPHII